MTTPRDPLTTTLYVCGPMTGIEDYNIPAFNAAAADLRAAGYTVVSPPEVAPYRPDWRWSDYMRADIAALVTCDGLALLPGWGESKGARTEVTLAASLGMTVRHVGWWLS